MVKKSLSLVMQASTNTPLNNNILDEYLVDVPRHENAIDMFVNEWSSALPDYEKHSGPIGLFNDSRISWAEQTIGGFSDKHVLELGPLEGGHSYQMSKLGAKSILSIEANKRAFVKSLIVKNIYKIDNCTYLLGDFNQYFSSTDKIHDVILACGVLYHMKDPLQTLKYLATRCKQLIVWTHYYNPDVISTSHIASKFVEKKERSLEGVTVTYNKYLYQEALGWGGFCGGYEQYANWLSQDDILNALKAFGMKKITLGKDEPLHQNGPSFLFVAER